MSYKKIEDYICTLEQAKKLKELGFNEEPLFGCWVRDFKSDEFYFAINVICQSRGYKYAEVYPAYTSQEFNKLIVLQLKFANGYLFNEVGYDSQKLTDFYTNFTSNLTNEAQARADYIINLLEKNKK